MKSIGREIGYAILAWLAPFVMSICIFSMKDSNRKWFEMLMSLTLTTNTAVLALMNMRRISDGFLTRAIAIGLTWLIANWTLDLIVFCYWPIQMTLRQYLKEIAGAYLVIPVITISIGLAFRMGKGRSDENRQFDLDQTEEF